jgi:hypothetical protein
MYRVNSFTSLLNFIGPCTYFVLTTGTLVRAACLDNYTVNISVSIMTNDKPMMASFRKTKTIWPKTKSIMGGLPFCHYNTQAKGRDLLLFHMAAIPYSIG